MTRSGEDIFRRLINAVLDYTSKRRTRATDGNGDKLTISSVVVTALVVAARDIHSIV